MTAENDDAKILADILKSLDHLIGNKLWENSLFFRAIRKRLEDARDHFKEGLELDTTVQTGKTTRDSKFFSQEDMVEVYMALYISEGVSLRKWESLLNTLGSHAISSVSRPVYKNEQDIQESIRTKEFKQNDAYVAVYVRKSDIAAPYGKPPVDRHGRELIVLKEGAVRPENITRFVHVSGMYDFIDGMLTRRGNVDFF